MFFCEIRINSNCGLSKLSDVLEVPVHVSYVNPMSRGQNLVLSYARTDLSPEKIDFQSRDIINKSISGVGKFIVMNSVKRGHGIIHSIVDGGGFPIFPVVIGSGIENVACIVSSKEMYEPIIHNIERVNRIEDSTISRLRQEDLASLMNRNYVPLYGQLTTMELEILRSAVSNGYYKWPREYNLEDISNRFNIKKPTVLYHLRNAEKKILGLMFR